MLLRPADEEEEEDEEEEALLGLHVELSPLSERLRRSPESGKRIRAAYRYGGRRAAGQPDCDGVLRAAAAAAMELVHAAACTHDDVIDDSPMRRGRLTAHAAVAVIPGRSAGGVHRPRLRLLRAARRPPGPDRAGRRRAGLRGDAPRRRVRRSTSSPVPPPSARRGAAGFRLPLRPPHPRFVPGVDTRLVRLYEDVVPGHALRPMVPATVRHPVGDTLGDWPEVPRSPRDSAAGALPVFPGLLETIEDSSPFAQWALDAARARCSPASSVRADPRPGHAPRDPGGAEDGVRGEGTAYRALGAAGVGALTRTGPNGPGRARPQAGPPGSESHWNRRPGPLPVSRIPGIRTSGIAADGDCA